MGDSGWQAQLEIPLVQPWFNLQHDDNSCPEELRYMDRRRWHHYLAVGNRHGDFEWYHRKFKHNETPRAR